jgi:peptidyl-tRNA hydrolase, PTH1 family
MLVGMALFQKRPDASSHLPVYSLGLTKTILIVGLGNKGKEYEGTRHNIGFAAVDELANKQDFDPWIEKKDLKCQLTTTTIGDSRVILIKPTTFMNLSGEAVQAVMHFYKIPAQQMLAIHDELDIPFGQIRTRNGGSAAGHNGVKSVIQHVGEDFARVRIGIQAETPMEASDFVLAKFSKEEQTEIPAMLKETTAILTEYIHGGKLLQETRSFLI